MRDAEQLIADALRGIAAEAELPGPVADAAWRAGRRRRLAASTAAVAAAIALALTVVLPLTTARGPAAVRGSQSHPAGKPVTSIAIQNASETDFVLNGRLELVVAVEYLRVGRSASYAGPVLPLSGGTTWVTVVVTGLPAYGPDYTVTAGECSHGRAVSLGEPDSGRADPAGMLILQVANVPVPFDSSRFWIQVSSVTGQILAEIRGPIFPPTNGRLIAPSTPICRAA
jgi:hypothetical protein